MACLQAQIAPSAAGFSRRQVSVPVTSRPIAQHAAVQPVVTSTSTFTAAPHAQAASSRSSCVARAAYHGSVMAGQGTRYAVVVAKFNSLITKGLLTGAMETFEAHGVPEEHIDVAWVPGSFELPVVAKQMAKSGEYAAVVCIGAIIRGATTHYDAVVSAATSGVLHAGTDTGVPVIFGVLTTDDLEQALDRTGGKVGNKGGEAALTAIETATLLAKLRAQGKAQ